MSEQFAQLESKHIQFIGEQHIYFVGTAGAEGYVNVSPKGMDSLRVISPDRVIWLNLTGSGNETAAHVLENGRMTLMFCSFEKQPLILRLYGVAEAIHPHEENWSEWIGHFPVQPGARQIFNLQINLVQTSCGFAVPYYEFTGDRNTLTDWAARQGEQSIQQYWQKNNLTSLNGKSTGITVKK